MEPREFLFFPSPVPPCTGVSLSSSWSLSLSSSLQNHHPIHLILSLKCQPLFLLQKLDQCSSTRRSQILSTPPCRISHRVDPSIALPRTPFPLEFRALKEKYIGVLQHLQAAQHPCCSVFDIGWGSHNKRGKRLTKRYQLIQKDIKCVSWQMIWKCTYMSSKMDPQSRRPDCMFLSGSEGLPGSRRPPARASEDLGLTPNPFSCLAWERFTRCETSPLFILACPHSSQKSIRLVMSLSAHQLQRTCLKFIPEQES